MHSTALYLSYLLGLNAAAEDDLAGRPSHHDTEEEHDHDDFESFVVRIPPVEHQSTLSERAARAASETMCSGSRASPPSMENPCVCLFKVSDTVSKRALTSPGVWELNATGGLSLSASEGLIAPPLAAF